MYGLCAVPLGNAVFEEYKNTGQSFRETFQKSSRGVIIITSAPGL